jgi:hypothetical protein
MDDRLKNAYTKVINKHYSAVQTDERLGQTDEYKPGLEKRARQFWADYEAADAEFKALLEKCVVGE